MKKYLPLLIVLMTFTGALASQIIVDLYRHKKELSTKEKSRVQVVTKRLGKASFRTFENKLISISENKAPIVIINFWASWCSNCLGEFPSMVEFRKRYEEKDVLLIGISADDATNFQQLILKTKRQYQLNFPLVADPQGKWSEDFAVTAVPTTYFFYKGELFHLVDEGFDFMNKDFLKKIDKMLKKK